MKKKYSHAYIVSRLNDYAAFVGDEYTWKTKRASATDKNYNRLAKRMRAKGFKVVLRFWMMWVFEAQALLCVTAGKPTASFFLISKNKHNWCWFILLFQLYLLNYPYPKRPIFFTAFHAIYNLQHHPNLFHKLACNLLLLHNNRPLRRAFLSKKRLACRSVRLHHPILYIRTGKIWRRFAGVSNSGAGPILLVFRTQKNRFWFDRPGFAVLERGHNLCASVLNNNSNGFFGGVPLQCIGVWLYTCFLFFIVLVSQWGNGKLPRCWRDHAWPSVNRLDYCI